MDKPSARARWAEVDASGTVVASIALTSRRRPSRDEFGRRQGSAIQSTRRQRLGTRNVLHTGVDLRRQMLPFDFWQMLTIHVWMASLPAVDLFFEDV